MLDDETVIKAICSILDIDYEKIKDKLPEGEESTLAVKKMLEGLVPDGENGEDT